MKLKIMFLSLLAGASCALYADSLGTAFIYQGQLNAGGVAANGAYDFIFTLYDSGSSGSELGSPITTNGLSVSNGVFITSLDFGSQFNGMASWLAISVRSNNTGNYFALSPRQPLAPTPNALFASASGTAGLAASVSSASVTGAGIAGGTITASNIAGGQVVTSLNGLQDAVLLNPGSNITITPSGGTLTIAASGGAGSSWSLAGNTGTTAGVDYLGTTDDQPLEFWVNGLRVLRLEPSHVAIPNYIGVPNVIGGSQFNFVLDGVQGATIGGGGAAVGYGGGALNNPFSNNVTGDFGTVGGGSGNVAGIDATVGGGGGNTAGGNLSTVGGGGYNAASGLYSTVGGGNSNTAFGVEATVGGGLYNQATNFYATVPGGSNNIAGGIGSFAAGSNARATNQGAFVWSDSLGGATSTTNDSVTFRARGGYRFFTGTNSAGAQLLANATSWTTLSDKNAKKNFQPVNTIEVLDKLAAIPIQQWNYKWENDTDVPNIGPMAQDFKHAFYAGRDDKGISTLEFDGVELAAIQGLNQKLEEKEARIQEQAAEIQALQQNLAELRKLVETIAQKK